MNKFIKIKDIIKQWLIELFCKHQWVHHNINEGYYDEEGWYTCTKCGKEYDLHKHYGGEY